MQIITSSASAACADIRQSASNLRGAWKQLPAHNKALVAMFLVGAALTLTGAFMGHMDGASTVKDVGLVIMCSANLLAFVDFAVKKVKEKLSKDREMTAVGLIQKEEETQESLKPSERACRDLLGITSFAFSVLAIAFAGTHLGHLDISATLGDAAGYALIGGLALTVIVTGGLKWRERMDEQQTLTIASSLND